VTEFFSSVRGAPSLYVDNEDGALTDCRCILLRHGEDADLAIEMFWKEHDSGRFAVIPLFSHGNPPRRELCSQKSLAAALVTATIEPGSTVEQSWREVCEALHVAWPKRLQAA